MDYKVTAIGSDNKPQLELKHKKTNDQKRKESSYKGISFEQCLEKEMRK